MTGFRRANPTGWRRCHSGSLSQLGHRLYYFLARFGVGTGVGGFGAAENQRDAGADLYQLLARDAGGGSGVGLHPGLPGRMQAVLLHAGVGLLQGGVGIHGAWLGEAPMLVCSGEAISYGENPELDPQGQWYRNLSVVGGPNRFVEPFTKWSGQATSPHTLYEQLVRAGEMAQRVPKGPAFLDVPIETMIHPWESPEKIRPVPAAPKTRPAGCGLGTIGRPHCGKSKAADYCGGVGAGSSRV